MVERTYDIYKAPESTAPSAAEGEFLRFLANLDSYSVKSGNISYIDRSSGMEVILKNLDHSGSGSFSQSVLT